MRKIFTFVFALFFMVGLSAVSNAAPRHSIDFSGKKQVRLAVIPYINLSGDISTYVLDDLRNGYTDYFAKEGFGVVPKEKVDEALRDIEYNTADNIIATEETLKVVAEKTNADFVIAMEVEEISTVREDNFPNVKITAKIKLLYEIYQKSGDKFNQFRIATSRDNKAVLADVGPKYAVDNALRQSLDRGNNRLIEIINKN